MQYTDVLDEAQVAAYLRKLEITDPICVNTDWLHKLLFAQLTHVPFDSLDVWGAGICPSLAVNDLFHKIVVLGRGGYCFELNTLFRALLSSLGFDAYQVVAFISNADGTRQPPAHNAILCNLNGKKYFLDVGYGGPVPYEPLELKAGVQGAFALHIEEDFYQLFRIKDDEELPLIQFRDVPVAVEELIPLNFFVSQNPNIHHFHDILHLNRRNPDGSIYSVDGNEFKIQTSSGSTVRQLQDIQELKEVMLEYFHMDPTIVPLRDRLNET